MAKQPEQRHTDRFKRQLSQVLTKTTPPPKVCPLVPRGPEVAPKPSLRGFVLNHQISKKPKVKVYSKTVAFDKNRF